MAITSKKPLVFGYYAALATSLLTLVTFIIAFLTPPLSGPFCTSNCFQYPYLDIASRFPRDYYWMFPALLLMLVFLILVTTIYHVVEDEKKLYSHVGYSFAFMSTLLLVTDFFLQLSIVQPSLLAGESDGVSMLTQFNPHGVFIALEELGYVCMGLALLFIGLVFGEGRLEKSIRWICVTACIALAISFGAISYMFGLEREYRFEVASITINWLALIVLGVLLAKWFKRRERKS